MAIAIARNPFHAGHDEPYHVEQALRLETIMAALQYSGMLELVDEIIPQAATERQILAVHDPKVLEVVRSTAQYPKGQIDGDTYTTEFSYKAALWSAGTAISAVDAVLDGRAKHAFALTRPPGHHATDKRPMGFCFFNNVAVAARHALMQHGLQRVAIVDFDVHHGNGTQDCFYDDSQVLFCSTHAAPLYPHTGELQDFGEESGFGLTLNMPLPHFTNDDAIVHMYDEVLIPALESFQPELILVSAGFDGHWQDPIGAFCMSTHGYATLVERLRDAALRLCDGRMVMVLEGGYHLEALTECVLVAFRVLLDLPWGEDRLGKAGMSPQTMREIRLQVEQVAHELKWMHPLLH